MLATHLHISKNTRLISAKRVQNNLRLVCCTASSPSTCCSKVSKPASLLPWVRQQRSSSHVTRVAQRPLSAVLSDIEDLKSSADALEEELAAASRAAEVAAKRTRRLAARSQELQEYALEHVMLGDEPAARAALQQKAAVADALRQASRRAEANSALARKLEEVLMLTQSQLLAMIREANRQQAAASTRSFSQADPPVLEGASGRSVTGTKNVRR